MRTSKRRRIGLIAGARLAGGEFRHACAGVDAGRRAGCSAVRSPPAGRSAVRDPAPPMPMLRQPRRRPQARSRCGGASRRRGCHGARIRRRAGPCRARIWKLGRMYADGDGVAAATSCARSNISAASPTPCRRPPGTPQARFVANAFVALGHFYLDGIPNSTVKAGPGRGARHVPSRGVLFRRSGRAVSVWRASISTAPARRRMRCRRRAGCARGQQGPAQAQALLGACCSRASTVPRQAAAGLFWLTLARTAPGRRTRQVDHRHLCTARVRAGDRGRARAGAQLSRALDARAAATRSRIGCTPVRAASFRTARSPDQTTNRHVVGRLFPSAHVLVDAGADEPVGGLRRQQHMVDADAVVLLPGAGLIVPERVEAGLSLAARTASVKPRLVSARKRARVCGRNSASLDPGRRIAGVGGASG